VLCPDVYLNADMDAEVERAFSKAVQVMRDLGAKVETVSFAYGKRLMELFSLIAGPEFVEFHRPFYEKDSKAYGPEVRERVEGSLKITMDEYVRALRERQLLRREMADFFRGVDALLLPSMPCTAPPIKTLNARVNGKEHNGMWIHRPFQSPHNVTGCPAVSLPMGFDGEGMPLSLQIVGPEWSEARILAIAGAYEDASPEVRSAHPPC
jgi:aspartyl-tRNA(Asn)/glutamyl-tRNA(Gln) amidotransferase subunit A